MRRDVSHRKDPIPSDATRRVCGDCQLCCKLLPIAAKSRNWHIETIEAAIRVGVLTRAEADTTVRDFDKPAGERCPHQRHRKGCAIYPQRPFGCRFWNCRWLINDDTDDLSRPDRVHYVIDVSPDYVKVREDGQQLRTIPVIQIWADRHYRDAWLDPALRAYLERRGREGWAALVRINNNREAYFVCPPAMSKDGKWHTIHSVIGVEPEHSIEDKVREIGPMTVVIS
jgi:hypothetical protein